VHLRPALGGVITILPGHASWVASISRMVEAAVFTSPARGADLFASLSGQAKNVDGNSITTHGPGTTRQPISQTQMIPPEPGHHRFRDEASVAS